MEEIRRLPVEGGSLSSHHVQKFFTSKRWLGMGFLNHQQHHLISSPTDFEDWLVVGLVSETSQGHRFVHFTVVWSALLMAAKPLGRSANFTPSEGEQ